ncbi:uncharacterized protein [Arachis hypogaea]|uniref:uncharacterized protein n=1 Tax=Arachis hypogaea TaxID=3818 RepID=UPI003B222B2D
MASIEVHDSTMEDRRKVLVILCEKWYMRKEMHWKQMLRSRHAKEMDKNTRYFHNLARRRNNRIDMLVINRRLIRNQARIKIAIREFYKDLYHQERLLVVGFRDGLVNQIDEEESAALERMSMMEEVREAFLDCESSKAPCSDGYNMNFIKKCWDEIGAEFTVVVLDFFRSLRLPSDSNIMWVALAPKFVGAKEIKDFWPISMKMGFDWRWREWVKECVGITSMSILINNSPSKPFKMEKELRQAFKEICDGLKLFYDVTQLFSGSKFLTANLTLICIKKKFEKYWDEIHGNMGVAAVLDPRYKMVGFEF